jgi:urease accessory protein
MTESLPRAVQVLPAGGWVERTARHRVTLDFDDRFRRRKRYVAEDGFAFLLDLEEATALRQGDGLLLEGGGVILVQAAPEPLIEITAETPERLARLAWHLGNRHLPTQQLQHVEVAFDPEGGAYGEHNRHPGHHHHHGDGGHDHDHGDGHHHHHH